MCRSTREVGQFTPRTHEFHARGRLVHVLPGTSKLIDITNTSLDGHIEDVTGAFDWVIPDESHFDRESVLKLKRESAHDIFIGGAELAAVALEANLVDECHLFLNPVIVGRGKPAFRAALRLNLELLETHRFGTGVVHVRHRIRGVAH